MSYPVTDKVQRKQLARDERALERAIEVLGRLNLTAERPGALALAIEKIKQGAPDDLGRRIYPVTDNALCKQLRRDERAIKGAIELVKRMGKDPDKDSRSLDLTQEAVNEHKKDVTAELLRQRPPKELTEAELLE